jgi:alkylhydroperoxidase family enzyme
MLGFLEKMNLAPDSLGPDDVVPLRRTGLSDRDIEDAMLVCMGFNVMNRLAGAFDFRVPSPKGFDRWAKQLMKRGYARIPRAASL